MQAQDYKIILEFSDDWLALGIVTDDDLLALGAAYDTGDDPHTEHYRWGAFSRYLKQHRPLSPSACEALYALGYSDPDPMMGGAMMWDIVVLPECPLSVLHKALCSRRQKLVRKVKEKLADESPPFGPSI